jgi:multidrug efflux pump
MNLSKFFIDRPIFAGVLSLLIFIAGLIALRSLPICRVPRRGAAHRGGARQLSRRQPQGDRRDGGHAAGGIHQRRRRHALHEQPGHHRRPDDAERHLQAGHRPRQGPATGAEPRLASRAAPARGSAPPGHHHHQELARPDHGGALAVAQRPLRHDLPAQLRGAQRQGPPGAHQRRGPGAAVRFGRLLDARLARPAESGASAACPPATWCAPSASRTSRPPPAWWALRRACKGVDMQLSINAQGRLQNEEEFGDIIVKTDRRRRDAPARHPAWNWARRTTRCARCWTTSRRWPCRCSPRRAPTPSRSPTTCKP